jgi:prevent-host-death family protein
MIVTRLSVKEVRDDFATKINQVAYRKERVVLVRHGKDIAAIVPLEDFHLLEALEDRFDIEAARRALADPANATPIPWEKVKADLGL